MNTLSSLHRPRVRCQPLNTKIRCANAKHLPLRSSPPRPWTTPTPLPLSVSVVVGGSSRHFCPPPGRFTTIQCSSSNSRTTNSNGATTPPSTPTTTLPPLAATIALFFAARDSIVQQFSRLEGLWGKFIPMSLLFFLMAFINTILDSLKDSLVITAVGGGTQVLPYLSVYGVLPCSVLFLFLYSWGTQRFSRATLFNTIIIGFLVFYAGFGLAYPSHETLHLSSWADSLAVWIPSGLSGMVGMARNWLFTLFYCFSELWGDVALSLLFWGLANETTSIEDAPLLYPLFGIGANIAQTLAGRALRVFSDASGVHMSYTHQLQGTIGLCVGMGLVVISLHAFISKTFPKNPKGSTMAKIAAEKRKANAVAASLNKEGKQQRQLQLQYDSRENGQTAATPTYSSNGNGNGNGSAGGDDVHHNNNNNNHQGRRAAKLDLESTVCGLNYCDVDEHVHPSHYSNGSGYLESTNSTMNGGNGHFIEGAADNEHRMNSSSNGNGHYTTHNDDDKDEFPLPPTTTSTSTSTEKEKKKKSMTMIDAFMFLRRSPQIQCLAVMALAQGITTRLLDVTWKHYLHQLHATPAAYAAFLGDTAMWTGIVTGTLMFTSPMLFDKIGWKGVASTTPTFMLWGGLPFFMGCVAYNFVADKAVLVGAVTLQALVITGAVLQVLSKGAKFSLFKPAEEMVYIGLDDESRSKGKAAIDVVGAQSGKSIVSVMQQALLILTGGTVGGILPALAVFYAIMLHRWNGAVDDLAEHYDPAHVHRQSVMASIDGDGDESLDLSGDEAQESSGSDTSHGGVGVHVPAAAM